MPCTNLRSMKLNATTPTSSLMVFNCDATDNRT